jgi:hypothetical protein
MLRPYCDGRAASRATGICRRRDGASRQNQCDKRQDNSGNQRLQVDTASLKAHLRQLRQVFDSFYFLT